MFTLHRCLGEQSPYRACVPAEACSPTGQVDLDLLRSQQLKLYILKAGRALLSHQDQLRQILSQPAVQEAVAVQTGTLARKVGAP